MENPLQVDYSVEELFTLKPEIIEDIKPPATVVVKSPETSGTPFATIPAVKTSYSSFWNKYKWYLIAGGIVVAGGICFIIYKQNQKKKTPKNK